MLTRIAHTLRQKVGSQSAFTLVQAMLLVLVLATFGLIVAQMTQRIGMSLKQANSSRQAKLSRDQFINIARSDSAWSKTIAQSVAGNSAVTIADCISDPDRPGGVCPSVPQLGTVRDPDSLTSADLRPLILYKADGTIFYDPSKLSFNPQSGRSVKSGLKEDGTVCENFDDAADAPEISDCPFRMEYRWGFVCNPKESACQSPVVLYGDLKVSKALQKANFNTSRFRIREVLRTEATFLRSACESLSATGLNVAYDPSATGEIDATGAANTACRCNNDGGIISLGCKTLKDLLGDTCQDGQIITYDSAGGSFSCRDP